jgi:hypothetical protein
LPKNDEGEFELVLGNKQLISVFVIVVVLLGVFFSMGYIVGRNSPVAATETARNDKPKPDHEPDAPDAAAPLDDPSTPATDSTSSGETAPSAPPQSNRPAQSPPASSRTQPPAVREVKPKPSPVPPPAAPEHAAPIHASGAGDPASGQYWQVVATARPDAEIIAEALGKKGFHVVLAPAPKDGIFRVLVGPLSDAPALATTRTGLESAGFKNPIMRKY